MRVQNDIGITDSMTIYDAPMPPGKGALDPINVILRDFGGSGQIIVECYGAAWSHWFGGIGKESLRQFIAGCSADYIATKLVTTTVRRNTKSEDGYVLHIASAVVEAMKGSA